MNGYKITTMRPIYHNDKFSHNILEDYTVHAETQREAELSLTSSLKSGDIITDFETGMVIKIGEEWIYHTEFLGQVVLVISCRYELPDEVKDV